MIWQQTTSCSIPCLSGISNCCRINLPQNSPSPLWSWNPGFYRCCHFSYLMSFGNLKSLLGVALGSKVVRSHWYPEHFFQLLWFSWLIASLSSPHILVSQSREDANFRPRKRQCGLLIIIVSWDGIPRFSPNSKILALARCQLNLRPWYIQIPLTRWPWKVTSPSGLLLPFTN